MTVSPDTTIINTLLTSEAFSNFMETYNVTVSVILSLVTIGIIVLLFLNVTKLSAAGDNESQRRLAINGILICLVCLGLIGGVDTVYIVLLSIVFKGGV